MELLDNLYCHAINKYEDFTHWYWNKSPHRVRCIICGDIMNSKKDKYSPEEAGWRSIKGGKRWICHRCDAHRDFKPYVNLVDVDEEIKWAKFDISKERLEQLDLDRKKILIKLLTK